MTHYIDHELDSLKTGDGGDPTPTSGFQRVVQRAILHVQSSGKDEVTGANVLVALFSEAGHHHIPIIDAESRLVGIITQSDLVRALYRAVRVDG